MERNIQQGVPEGFSPALPSRCAHALYAKESHFCARDFCFRARTDCTPHRGSVPGRGCTLTFLIPSSLSRALLSNALIGCSLFIFIFFPCGSKCLNFFFFNFRKLKTEGGMLLESVTQKKKGFALQPSLAPGDSSIKKVVFHCS